MGQLLSDADAARLGTLLADYERGQFRQPPRRDRRRRRRPDAHATFLVQLNECLPNRGRARATILSHEVDDDLDGRAGALTSSVEDGAEIEVWSVFGDDRLALPDRALCTVIAADVGFVVIDHRPIPVSIFETWFRWYATWQGQFPDVAGPSPFAPWSWFYHGYYYGWYWPTFGGAPGWPYYYFGVPPRDAGLDAPIEQPRYVAAAPLFYFAVAEYSRFDIATGAFSGFDNPFYVSDFGDGAGGDCLPDFPTQLDYSFAGPPAGLGLASGALYSPPIFGDDNKRSNFWTAQQILLHDGRCSYIEVSAYAAGISQEPYTEGEWVHTFATAQIYLTVDGFSDVRVRGLYTGLGDPECYAGPIVLGLEQNFTIEEMPAEVTIARPS
jgi:hypothetical protein